MYLLCLLLLGSWGGRGERMDKVQPSAGTPPPWLDGDTGKGLGMGHRNGEGWRAHMFLNVGRVGNGSVTLLFL